MSCNSNVFMIVPAWFSDRVEEDEIERLLSMTLTGAERIAEPDNQYVYIDGVERVLPIAERIREQTTSHFQIVNATENKGKGKGVVAGLQRGLADSTMEWFAVRDADGDHRVDDFSAMLELGRQMQEECEDAPILVVGGRNQLEPPLTLYRAVYEKILNGVIDAALQFALAKKNYAPNQIYYRQYGPWPDLQSGYKLYNRKAAELAVEAFEQDEEERDALYRWGAEVVPYVWIALHRGIAGEQRRSTYREQPVTAYASIQRAEFYAQKLRWVFRQCEVSLWNAARMLDNELSHCVLMFDGMGRTEMLNFRKAVLQPLKRRDADEPPPFRGGARFI